MPEESFAKLFAAGNINTGDKYGNNGGNNNKPKPPSSTSSNPRPRYDGGGKYLANGVDERILRNLRRGKAEGEVDLHGMTADAAITALADFVMEAQSRGLRDIEVIHGKGAGILKPKVRQWLAQCREVLAFTEVNNNSGAVRVCLRA